MPNLVNSVVSQLQQERNRLEKELHRITVALSAFGNAYRRGGATAGGRKHKISAEGRKRIAAAQRARWAKARAAK